MASRAVLPPFVGGTAVPKPFQEAFEEWRKDDRYKIGEDIGWEYSDVIEPLPTSGASSSTPKDDVRTANSVKEVLSPGETPG
jgi:hypothetical protein